MKKSYKVIDLEKLKKDLKELDFIEFDIIEETGEFLVIDNRFKKRWDKFWNKDWLCQVLKHRKTNEFWICFTDCNIFKSLELEETLSFIKIVIGNTQK